MKKKAVFLGASNTYGVGLWFFREHYLDLNNLDTRYPYPIESREDIEFTHKNRFSFLLSNYLNLKEVNVGEAGGSPAESLYLLNKMDLNEIEYVIFEFSALTSFFDKYFYDSPNGDINKLNPRTPSEIESFLTNGKNDRQELREKIYKWLDNFDPIEYTVEVFNTIQKFINDNKHIKFIILVWRNSDVKNVKLDSEDYLWLSKYSPKFPIEKNSNNILVESYLKENKHRVCDEFIHHDLMDFPIGHKDLHPSVNGHKKIFEILKSYIDEKNSTNSW